MSPPSSEQLIRDYLNRLSMAARGQLGAEDRRALVDRTHDFIDRNIGDLRQVDPTEVAALLHRLGDPAAMAALEYGRLAVIRGETESPAPAPRRGRVPAIRLRPEPGTASWHWPRAAGHPRILNQILTAIPDASADSDVRAGNGVPAVRDVPAGGGGPAGDGVSAVPDAASGGGPAGNGVPAVPEAPAGNGALPVPPPRLPADAAAEADASATDRPASEPASAAEPSRPRWPAAVAMTSAPLVPGLGEPAATTLELEQEPEFEQEPELDAEPEPGPVEPTRARAEAILTGLRAWIREHRVEAIAAFLMGLGGAVFPPVWVLGATATFISKIWDFRDRWIGLAGPMVLLVVGICAGVSLGGKHPSLGSYIHEGWVYAEWLSRICALLGTYYLVWRVSHPWPEPEIPPWNRPHRVG
jgi:hypothetical protein